MSFDKSLMKRATEDSEEPTPGYMYRDIQQWTFKDHQTQTKLVAFLMDRLSAKNSVHILSKTLRIIRHLCENGHTDFQKEMQQNADKLKDFASYRGTQDARYGDKLNDKVRQNAKEAIDAAFSPRKETKLQIGQGHGSDATTSGSGSGIDVSGSGFTTGHKVSAGSTTTGHERIANMPTRNTYLEHMARGGGAVKEESSIGKEVRTAFKTGFGLWQESIKSDDEVMREKLTEQSNFQPMELGPNFGGGGGATTASGGGGSGGGTWQFKDEGGTAPGGLAPQEQTAKLLTPCQREVDRIAAFKNAPQRVDLTQFVATAKQIVTEGGSESYTDLAEALDARLSAKHPWQSRLNVMCCVEILIRQSVSSEIQAYFQENPEDIQRNVHVVQSKLKEKAQAILKLLQIPERTVASNKEAQQFNMATGGGDMTWAAGAAATTTTTTSTTQGNSEDVSGGGSGGADLDFAGMTVKQSASERKGRARGDTTKLTRRRQVQQQDDDDNVDQDAGSAAWGSGGGSASNATTSAGGGGWGAPESGGGGGFSSWGAEPQQQQQQQQQQQTQGLDVFDFGESLGNSNTAPQQQQQQPPKQANGGQQQQRDAFDDFFSGPVQPPPIQSSNSNSNLGAGGSSGQLDLMTTSAQQQQQPRASMSPPQQQRHQQQQQQQPTAAASPPGVMGGSAGGQQEQLGGGGGGANQQQMMMMQQQMAMLMQQMQAAGGASNPQVAAQFQALMAQQQTMMTQLMGGGGAGGGGGIGVPPPPQQQQQQQTMDATPLMTMPSQQKVHDDRAFAQMNEEMRRMMQHQK